MTTPEQNLNPFPPKLPVPVGESVIVHLSGKPPKVSTREYQGAPKIEVTFWLGIADKNYPELIGQYHAFVATPWISPGRPGNPNADPPVKAVQPSNLYKTILAIAGQEKATEFAYHDASLDLGAPEFNPDHADFVGEEKRAKAIPPEEWKAFRGFYVAKFKEPRKDKETGLSLIGADGGIFRQEVAELSPLKAARIFNEEQLLANITWPPPTLPPTPLGLPKGNQTPAKAEDKPQPKEPPAKEPAKVADLDNIKALLFIPGPLRVVAKKYLHMKAVDAIGALKEDGLKHLLALLRIGEHISNGGLVAANALGHLEARKKELHQLDFEDAVFLLVALDKAAEDDVPF